jgi:hypothetical protein
VVLLLSLQTPQLALQVQVTLFSLQLRLQFHCQLQYGYSVPVYLGYSEYPDTRKLFNAIIQRRPFGAVIICVDCTGSCYSQFRIESDNLKIAYELFMYMSERLNLLLPGFWGQIGPFSEILE